MNYYKRHLGDMAKSCGHLSQGAQGAYDLLLDWHYANEKPLPHRKADLYRIGRAFTKAERDNVDQVLEFFLFTDGGYVHKRALEEMGKASAQAEVNRQIAVERERRKKATNEARNEHDSCGNEGHESLHDSWSDRGTKQQPSHKPLASKKREAGKALGQQAARFAEFWAAYPVKKGRAEALAKWTARNLDAIADRIIADVEARKTRDRQWLDGYAPHGSTYVNGRGWEDEIEEARRPQPAASGGVDAAAVAR